MAYILAINYNVILNLFIFLHVWVLLVLVNLLKWLLDNFSNNSLRILAKALNYSFIETISQDNYDSSSDESEQSDNESGYISGFENNNSVNKNRPNERFLSFMYDMNFSKHNKYRFQSDEGIYIIRNAFTFRKNKDNNVCNIISIDNKLTIWCRIISPYKLYLDDIKRLAKEQDNNFYFFMILEELQSGFKHKLLIDVAKKITLPERRNIMFSKVSIQQYQQTSSVCDQS